MRLFSKTLIAVLCLTTAGEPLRAQFSQADTSHEHAASQHSSRTRRGLRWWESKTPVQDNPSDQLQHADQLREEGRLRAAARHYRILTFAWPNSPEAPVAQYNYAKILHQRSRQHKAFEEYQYLVDTYAGFFPYDQVVEKQYEIADNTATRYKRFLFIPYQDAEEAVPMFEQVIANAPTWERASEMQFRIARIHEKNKNYDLAVDAYSIFLQRYPRSPQAEAAFFGNARCWRLFSMRHPNDTALREQALSAQRLFLNAFPRSPLTETVRIYQQELHIEQAGLLYQQARLYDIMAGHTRIPTEKLPLIDAAIICYQRVIQEYPASRWADMSNARISQIQHRRPVVTDEE